MSLSMRRQLQLRRRVSDTTLRDLLCKLQPEGLRAVLHRAVKAARRRKALRPEGLPWGAVSMDGKGQALPAWDFRYVQRHVNDKTSTAYGLLRTVTSCLISAPGAPCIDVHPVMAWTNEMGTFQKAFGELVRHYGKLFKVVLYDAGAAGEENARAVLKAGKHYVFHLKDKRRHMFQTARWLCGRDAAPAARTEDVLSNAKVVVRELYLAAVRDSYKPNFCWRHTSTVLRVRSETYEHGVLTAREDRYFNTSLPCDALTPDQWLLLIRRHWRVENNCHWTFDAIFEEDDHPWIEMEPTGALAVLILRRVAYTLLTLFRSVTLRGWESRLMPWKNLLRWVYQTALLLEDEHLAGLRPRLDAYAGS